MPDETEVTSLTSKPRILVGLSNPATMAPLLEIAVTLAAEFEAEVHGFAVVGARGGANSTFGERLLKLACEQCNSQGVATTPLLVEAKSLHQGVLQAIAQIEPAYLILGYWPHREEDLQRERVLSRELQRVAKYYRGNLVITHFGESGVGHKLLAPLAGDTNLSLLGPLGRALLRRTDTTLTLAHVLPEDSDTAQHHSAMAFLRGAAERCGFLGEASLQVVSNSDVVEGILQLSWEFDALIVGLTRTRSLTERVLGSISDQVATWARGTTYLIRAAD